jgi:hypothetical protein
MAFGGLLTTQDILGRSGLGNQKTLTRWWQRGLIPPPTIRTHPSGRGKVGCWESWVLRRIIEVQNRHAQGESLDEIARALGQDWDSERKRFQRKRPNIKAMLGHSLARDLERWEAMDDFADAASALILSFIETMGMRRPVNTTDLVRTLRAASLIDRSLELLREGKIPLIVIVGRDVKVIPNFLLASALAHSDLESQPVLVVPIYKLLVESFSKIEPTLSPKPKYVPSTRVMDLMQKRSRERRYHHNGPWSALIDD